MSNIFFTSDWHFCHNKPFVYAARGFSSVEEMNETIVQKYNEVVRPGDIVYCLGDCILENTNQGLEYMRWLNGELHIIQGNHDSETRLAAYKSIPNVVEICCGKFCNYKKHGHFFLSHFPTLCGNYDDDTKHIFQNCINLCGHTHTTDKFMDINKGLIYHVEVDAHNCYPVNIETIISDLKTLI